MFFSSFFLVSVNRPYKTDSVPYYSGVVTPRNTFSTFFRCGFQNADNLTTSQETHRTDITKSVRPDSFCTFKINGNTGWLISHVSKQDSLHKYIFVFEMTLKSSLSSKCVLPMKFWWSNFAKPVRCCINRGSVIHCLCGEAHTASSMYTEAVKN